MDPQVRIKVTAAVEVTSYDTTVMAVVVPAVAVAIPGPGPGGQGVCEVVEGVAQDPHNAVADAVYVGVVLGAGQGGRVLLDGDDAVPPPGEGEGDGVAAGAAEDVD